MKNLELLTKLISLPKNTNKIRVIAKTQDSKKICKPPKLIS